VSNLVCNATNHVSVRAEEQAGGWDQSIALTPMSDGAPALRGDFYGQVGMAMFGTCMQCGARVGCAIT